VKVFLTFFDFLAILAFFDFLVILGFFLLAAAVAVLAATFFSAFWNWKQSLKAKF